jgi:hypothetical protein
VARVGDWIVSPEQAERLVSAVEGIELHLGRMVKLADRLSGAMSFDDVIVPALDKLESLAASLDNIDTVLQDRLPTREEP